MQLAESDNVGVTEQNDPNKLVSWSYTTLILRAGTRR